MRDFRIWILLAALSVSASAPAASLEVVYVVRHAQKEEPWDADGRLQPLSSKGVTCAGRLAEMLADGVSVVYTTETVRTLATGVAVSGGSPHVEIFGDDASASPSSEWVRHVLRMNRKESAILFVGHSNTVGHLVRAFRPDVAGCQDDLGLAEVPASRYGDVWRLELTSRQDCLGVTRESLGKADGVDCTTP